MVLFYLKLNVDVNFGALHFCGASGTEFRSPYFGWKSVPQNVMHQNTHLELIWNRMRPNLQADDSFKCAVFEFEVSKSQLYNKITK